MHIEREREREKGQCSGVDVNLVEMIGRRDVSLGHNRS